MKVQLFHLHQQFKQQTDLQEARQILAWCIDSLDTESTFREDDVAFLHSGDLAPLFESYMHHKYFITGTQTQVI